MNDSDFLRFEQLYQDIQAGAHIFPQAEQAAFRAVWPEFVRLRGEVAALRAAVPSVEVLRLAAELMPFGTLCRLCSFNEKCTTTCGPDDPQLCEVGSAALRQAAAALEKLLPISDDRPPA